MQLQTITFFFMVEYKNGVYIIFLKRYFHKIYSLLQILSGVVNYCTLILKDNFQSTS